MNDLLAPVDLVPRGRNVMSVDPIRGFNGRYMSFAGVQYTRPERSLDYKGLTTISRTGVDNDNDLAEKLGMDPKDRMFRLMMERLATQGCLIRKIFEWHYTGKWVPVENPSFTLTAAGEHMAREKCPED